MLSTRLPETRLALLPGLLSLALSAGCAPTSFIITPVSADQRLRERVILRESDWATEKVALVEVEGLIRNARETSLLGVSGENPVSLFAEKLAKAASDDHVRAVVLRINSPGGTVTASDLMHQELLDFRRRTGKPVIATMMDIGTSGGYYLACAADRIHAHATTITGSIGVIMLLPELTGTMQKIGMTMNVIKSGRMKDSGSMFREMSPEDRELLQGLVDGMYERFVEVVARARPGIEAARLRELADGRVFLGPEAKELGLVDEIGTLREAVDAAKQAAGLTGEWIKVVRYDRPPSYRPNIYAYSDVPPGQVNVINLQLPRWLDDPAPQLLYLWAPGW